MFIVKKRTLFAVISAAVLGAALILYLLSGRIYLYVFSRTHNLDISCSKITNISFGHFEVTDLMMRDRASGFSISSKASSMLFRIRDIRLKDVTIDFRFKDVRFGKKGGKENLIYSSLTGLVAIPFDSRWQYNEMSGKIKTMKGGSEIKDFSAAGKDIKLSIKGTVLENDTINLDIIIYFGKELYDMIAPEVAGILLSKEENDWSSLSVHLEGDYKTPSIQLSSKLFRLNIKAISGT